jgi:hypothetical protein
MSDEQQKLLTKMLERFREKHGRWPEKIVVAPVALVGLAVKKSIAPVWNGIPVECRLFTPGEAAGKWTEEEDIAYLGIFARENRGRLVLAACDLKRAVKRDFSRQPTLAQAVVG